MEFIGRQEELARLMALGATGEGGFAVLHGRRRIGKTRLLLEWTRRADGLYTVADQSASDVQRRYFAQTVATRFPGFDDVEYRDWRGLLTRLAREAGAGGWHGPLVLDELPYLVVSAPELPSVLQQWLDHDAKAARLVVAVAGSSQRMMQGFVLSSSAPLYGRAREVLDLPPLDPEHLGTALGAAGAVATTEAWAAWGGVPRYWELAAGARGDTTSRIARLVLDPLGPLHREPDLLLLEEIPPATEVRPLLDAIGAGAHRVSEIASRAGKPATSLSRPLERLVAMGLVRREVPFGEPERGTRRSLYRMADPFFRLWFRVVAPHRALLLTATAAVRAQLLARHWPALCGAAWEDLCRLRVPHASARGRLGRLGPWGPPSRWWQGNLPEWDIVAESVDGKRLLLGEARWSGRAVGRDALNHAVAEVAARPGPALGPRYAGREVVRAVFVPEVRDALVSHATGAPIVVAGRDLLP
jgi:AAA+ ATPase superfamily predicted ATPase